MLQDSGCGQVEFLDCKALCGVMYGFEEGKKEAFCLGSITTENQRPKQQEAKNIFAFSIPTFFE
eukprot:m.55983 g.55983  ORF g.55983 m.55983 type:complete len:64 (+) comp11014_c0_seq2:3550-3741(+)